MNAISVTAVVPSLSVPCRKLKLPLAETPPMVTEAPVSETSTNGPAATSIVEPPASVWLTATLSVLKATENAPGLMERSPGRWVKMGSAFVALPLNCPATPAEVTMIAPETAFAAVTLTNGEPDGPSWSTRLVTSTLTTVWPPAVVSAMVKVPPIVWPATVSVALLEVMTSLV